MNKEEHRSYEFDQFRLDVAERLLFRGREEVALTPKVFETLLVLVEHSGHIVGKDELFKAVWPDSFVEESSLTQNISLLRKTLGEGGDGRRFIETIPKRGYRFTVPVRLVNNGAAAEEQPPPAPANAEDAAEEVNGSRVHRPEATALRSGFQLDAAASRADSGARRRVVMLAVAVLLLAATGGSYLWRAKRPSGAIADGGSRVRSLAVLPFTPLGGESRDEFFGLGMADALILKLGSFDGLTVRPTSSVAKYTGRGHDAREVGKQLGVDAVLGGTMQHAGDRVRVTAALLDLRDGTMIWSGTFDERSTDMFALQDSISGRVSSALELRLAGEGGPRPARRFTESAEAHQLYSMGLYFWNKRTPEGLSKAVEYFRRATEIDPNYALAFAGLADTYTVLAANRFDLVTCAEAHRQAQAAAARALHLDGSLPEALAAVGVVKEHFEGDLEGAERMYRRALDLNPSFSTVYMRYGFLLLTLGRDEEAVRQMRRAHELDPLSPTINTNMSLLSLAAHQPDEAIRYARMALEVNPEIWRARVNLGEACEAKGMYDEAAAEYRKLADDERRSFYGKQKLIYLYATTGQRSEAQRLFAETQQSLRERKPEPDAMLSAVLANIALGRKDQAFEWLNRAADAGVLTRPILQYSPKLDPIRLDPRFESLQRRLKSGPRICS